MKGKTKFHWNNISIAHKLHAVIGVMAVLVFIELFILWFVMDVQSSVRAFVHGEGLWSKAQKDASLNLYMYTTTKDVSFYTAFVSELGVCMGDRIARQELLKQNPDYDNARRGFLKGRIHPSDIDPMFKLLRRFYWQSHIAQAVKIWGQADIFLEELYQLGLSYHEKNISNLVDNDITLKTRTDLDNLNKKLTILEDDFSSVLGEGSRWLEKAILRLLSILVISVEGIGITLALVITNSTSRRLTSLSNFAQNIGKGNFSERIIDKSQDEIGKVIEAVNQMGEKLQYSYSELEDKVHQRTLELEEAVQARDTFLSIASHELKTPLTTLNLKLQLRKRNLIKNKDFVPSSDQYQKMIMDDSYQVDRLIHRVSEMLDVSKINQNKFTLNKSKADISSLVSNCVERFSLNFEHAGCLVKKEIHDGISGELDTARIEQVVDNLLTNALKYGAGSMVTVRLWQQDKFAYLSVKDLGPGIAKEDQTRIFEQFERAVNDISVSGLGLGLYISKQIVSMHGGEIEVESCLNQGTTFTIKLPIIFNAHS